MALYIALLTATNPEFYNLVDFFCETFGKESLDLLFNAADAIFDLLMYVMGPKYEPLLVRVWEVLFT